jgi:hypothetical protein
VSELLTSLLVMSERGNQGSGSERDGNAVVNDQLADHYHLRALTSAALAKNELQSNVLCRLLYALCAKNFHTAGGTWDPVGKRFLVAPADWKAMKIGGFVDEIPANVERTYIEK